MNNTSDVSHLGRSRLLAALTGAGFPPAVLSEPGLGEVHVLPHGGRVIGLLAGEGDENLLWINSALGHAGSAREALNAAEWVHLGGDRTWVSPEYELFVGDLARPWETYRVPAALDPGHYAVSAQPGQINLQPHLKQQRHKTGATHNRHCQPTEYPRSTACHFPRPALVCAARNESPFP